MPGFSIKILFLTLLLAVFSGAGFYYLSYHPDMMLWVEEYHPSNAYQRGRQLQAEGRLEEALNAYENGCDFFKRIAQEKPTIRYRRLYAQGFLERASVYQELRDSRSLQRAVEMYEQAWDIDPSIADGQPFLSGGMLLSDMGKYQEAVQAYSGAIEHGSARVALEALLGRGECYYALEKYRETGLDWYRYARYKRGLSVDRLNGLCDLPVDSCPQAYYIHARRSLMNGRKNQSMKYWVKYLEAFPQDRSARFYYHRLINQTVPLQEHYEPRENFFPLEDSDIYLFSSTLADLYSNGGAEIELILELSLPGEGEEPANVAVYLNVPEPLEELTVYSPDSRFYEIPARLESGMNVLDLRVQQKDRSSKVTKLRLHSLQVREISPF